MYEISQPDVSEAFAGISDSEFEDAESLRALRVYQYRLDILRRVLLCSLLALEADGSKPDFARWREAIHSIDQLASISGIWSQKINDILYEEERRSTLHIPHLMLIAHRIHASFAPAQTPSS